MKNNTQCRHAPTSNLPKHDRTLLNLVDRHASEDFVRELLSWALHKVMEAEFGEITSAGNGQRAPEERETIRNGHGRRD